MRFSKWTLAAVAALALTGAAMIADQQAAAQDAAAPDQATLVRAARPPAKPIVAWAQKPTKLAPYVAPNKLVYRLADVLAAHKGKASWKQEVFSSRDFIGEWISMAPDEKTKTQFYADDRVFWVVESGAMKVTIEGQEPFIATKHFLVQVPKRLQYSMETVGSEPVLRFQMRPAGEAPNYPLSETPTPVKGITYVQATYTGHGDYDKINHPYIDFEKQIVQGGDKTGVWIRDDHTYVTILRSPKGVPTPPDNQWGHFHANFPEIWLIVEGTQQFLVEGEKLVTVSDGDLVAAPTGRYHRAMPFGDGPSTRLAYIPRPDNLHWFQPDEAGGGGN
jgi:mannose-6-phosphate isomerase-like protein (cupin superfamily)